MTVFADRDTLSVSSRIFQLNEIQDVGVRARKPFGLGGAVTLAIAAAVALATCLSISGAGEKVLAGVIAAILSYSAYRQVVLARTIEYGLYLATPHGEVIASTSFDKRRILALRTDVKIAIIRSQIYE